MGRDEKARQKLLSDFFPFAGADNMHGKHREVKHSFTLKKIFLKKNELSEFKIFY